jgi:hypothetical protein
MLRVDDPSRARDGARHGVPYRKVSYFGLEDTADALYAVSEFFGDPEVSRLARELVVEETDRVLPAIGEFRRDLEGKRAAVYVGGRLRPSPSLRRFGSSVWTPWSSARRRGAPRTTSIFPALPMRGRLSSTTRIPSSFRASS